MDSDDVTTTPCTLTTHRTTDSFLPKQGRNLPQPIQRGLHGGANSIQRVLQNARGKYSAVRIARVHSTGNYQKVPISLQVHGGCTRRVSLLYARGRPVVYSRSLIASLLCVDYIINPHVTARTVVQTQGPVQLSSVCCSRSYTHVESSSS